MLFCEKDEWRRLEKKKSGTKYFKKREVRRSRFWRKGSSKMRTELNKFLASKFVGAEARRSILRKGIKTRRDFVSYSALGTYHIHFGW